MAKRLGVPDEGWGLDDGSGLARTDLLTPRGLVALLVAMDRHPHAAAFRDSLPIAGVDGTLEKRMRGTPAERRVVAKTGTLQPRQRARRLRHDRARRAARLRDRGQQPRGKEPRGGGGDRRARVGARLGTLRLDRMIRRAPDPSVRLTRLGRFSQAEASSSHASAPLPGRPSCVHLSPSSSAPSCSPRGVRGRGPARRQGRPRRRGQGQEGRGGARPQGGGDRGHGERQQAARPVHPLRQGRASGGGRPEPRQPRLPRLRRHGPQPAEARAASGRGAARARPRPGAPRSPSSASACSCGRCSRSRTTSRPSGRPSRRRPATRTRPSPSPTPPRAGPSPTPSPSSPPATPPTRPRSPGPRSSAGSSARATACCASSSWARPSTC